MVEKAEKKLEIKVDNYYFDKDTNKYKVISKLNEQQCVVHEIKVDSNLNEIEINEPKIFLSSCLLNEPLQSYKVLFTDKIKVLAKKFEDLQRKSEIIERDLNKNNKIIKDFFTDCHENFSKLCDSEEAISLNKQVLDFFSNNYKYLIILTDDIIVTEDFVKEFQNRFFHDVNVNFNTLKFNKEAKSFGLRINGYDVLYANTREEVKEIIKNLCENSYRYQTRCLEVSRKHDIELPEELIEKQLNKIKKRSDRIIKTSEEIIKDEKIKIEYEQKISDLVDYYFQHNGLHYEILDLMEEKTKALQMNKKRLTNSSYTQLDIDFKELENNMIDFVKLLFDNKKENEEFYDDED